MDLAQRRALARRRKRQADRRGVALIMVLGAITVLTVFLTELQEETSSELASALADRDALKAEYFARSAVNLSRLLIAVEPEIRKPIQFIGAIPQIPVWEFTDMVLGTFNDQTGAQAFNGMVNADTSTAKNTGLTGGRFELKIIDEDSKLNINNASRGDPTSEDRVGAQLLGLMGQPGYDQMFEGRDPDNQFSDRQTICGAIVDWADEDEDKRYACDPKATGPSSNAAEDNFYQIINVPYRRKNAPYDSLEELRLVRGVGDDFWATFVDPDSSDAHKRIMTVWGQTGNKINANTANAMTLLGLICNGDKGSVEFCSDPLQLQGFLQLMSLVKSFGAGIPIFVKEQDFIDTLAGKGLLGPMLSQPPFNVKPITFANPNEIKKQITLKSKVFSIYATGVVPGFRRTTKVTIHAVVDFRAATAIGAAFGGISGTATGVPQLGPDGRPLPPGSPGTSIGQDTRNNQAATQMTPDQLAQVMATNPAGTVVYWRVE